MLFLGQVPAFPIPKLMICSFCPNDEKIEFNNNTLILELISKGGRIVFSISVLKSAARIGFRFRGNILEGLSRGRCGGGAPLTPEKFENLQKKFSRKLQKMDYFRRFIKKIKNHALNFRDVDEKPNCVGNFWESFQRFLWKKHKKCIILASFPKNFKTLRKIFARFDEKQLFWNFLRKFSKFSL